MTDRRGRRTEKNSSSVWKWAFISLLFLNSGIIIWLAVRLNLFSDSETIQTDSEEEWVVSDNTLEFELTTGREQISKVTNVYLNEELDERFSGYTVEIDDLIALNGALNVFGFEIDFGLFMEPLVMNNGNLQLRAERIQLGSFELPLEIALSTLEQQLELPEWVRINSEEEYILVAFDEFTLENNIQFQMTKIDLQENDIKINIILPEEAIK
ncbi:MAG: YpmS family protein [Alkalibacterium gilvum]|uniref:Uncharacterized protein YpmS n=1 Tax=Alkalibacterium gilvum TaxID=1130080 RepID=A0A1H6R284_9LACT|nr:MULTISPECIES: YpmS family protein [Alkalibacterium]MDN6293662.1 YpmS family protein [Alkalibacterium sp.]MDN6295291.1 YpmS family protein [Alkalibacterium sp.]MDN6729140.1 YpmS family protein [Alkalibacterium sp.]SEI49959.1 Uncharacterized protein YpmS [Alkalibacterium gilvum]